MFRQQSAGILLQPSSLDSGNPYRNDEAILQPDTLNGAYVTRMPISYFKSRLTFLA